MAPTPGNETYFGVSVRGPTPMTSSPRTPRGDEEELGKLFVGGLSWDTTQENLQRYFARFGNVVDCVVMKNQETGRSRGFGFVTYSDPNVLERVLANSPHNLDGRTIDPKACNPRSMQKSKKITLGYPSPVSIPNQRSFPAKIFLGGLPSSITETDLRNFFSRYGDVIEVVIMYDQEKKKSRGFGFLTFNDETACLKAVDAHYVNIHNKQVEIKRAEPRAHLSTNGNDSKIDGPEWGLMPAPVITNGQSRLLGDTSMPPQPFHGWTAQSSTFNQFGHIHGMGSGWANPGAILGGPGAGPTPQAHWVPVTTVPPPITPSSYGGPTAVTSSQYHHVAHAGMYVPSNTPQSHAMWGPTPAGTPGPAAQTPVSSNGIPPNDLYSPMPPLPTTSPHQVTKLAGYGFVPPPMTTAHTPSMPYTTFQSPPPTVGGQQATTLAKVPLHGQFIYPGAATGANGEYFAGQGQPTLGQPTSPEMMDGTMPRPNMFPQPNPVQNFHPYRRS